MGPGFILGALPGLLEPILNGGITCSALIHGKKLGSVLTWYAPN